MEKEKEQAQAKLEEAAAAFGVDLKACHPVVLGKLKSCFAEGSIELVRDGEGEDALKIELSRPVKVFGQDEMQNFIFFREPTAAEHEIAQNSRRGEGTATLEMIASLTGIVDLRKMRSRDYKKLEAATGFLC